MRWIVIAFATLLAGSAAAQSPAGSPAPFADAVKTFQQARSGDSSRIEPAIAAFDALAKAEPQQPLYAAYLGSALGLKAGDAWMPWSKVKYSEEGLDHLDRALAALKPEHDGQLVRGVPVSLETRLVAASMFVKLPDSIFHRRAAGLKLLDELLRNPALASAPAEFRATVQKAAEAARNQGQ